MVAITFTKTFGGVIVNNLLFLDKYDAPVSKPCSKDLAAFKDYVLECYSEEGMSEADAEKSIYLYLKGPYESVVYSGFHMWGLGDSLDREKVYEIYLDEVKK